MSVFDPGCGFVGMKALGRTQGSNRLIECITGAKYIDKKLEFVIKRSRYIVVGYFVVFMFGASVCPSVCVRGSECS